MFSWFWLGHKFAVFANLCLPTRHCGGRKVQKLACLLFLAKCWKVQKKVQKLVFWQMVESCTGKKSKSGLFEKCWKFWIVFHVRRNFGSFVKRLTLSLICYRLQLSCLDQIEEDFRIITLHFLFSLLLVKLEQLINEQSLC